MHTSNVIQTEQVVFRSKYTYTTDTYMLACDKSERGGHEGEGEWGGVYGRVWEEEKEGRNVVIYYNLKTEKKKKFKIYYGAVAGFKGRAVC